MSRTSVDDVVRGHFAVRMARRRDLQLGAPHQRMIELAGRAHGGIGNRAIVPDTKSIRPKLSASTPGSAASSNTCASAPCVSISSWHGTRLRDADSRRVASMNATISAASGTLRIFGSVM